MNAPASPDRAGLVQRLVLDLGAAFQLRTVYTPAHPQVVGAVERVVADLAALWQAGAPQVSFFLLEGQLLADRIPVPEEAPWGRGLLRAFRRHGIGGMTLLPGLDAAELGRFFDACLSPEGARPSVHVLLGAGGFAAGDGAEEPGPGAAAAAGGDRRPGPAAIPPDLLPGASDELRELASGGSTRIDRLRGLVAMLARGADGVSPESLRDAAARIDDRELLHGLAVALTTLRMGRAMGLEGEPLQDLALAGLLHDVGHLDAPTGIPEGAQRRGLHVLRGAARLAAIGGVPDVAVRVALEHHLRYDGRAGPLAAPTRRQPCAAARVVAVADTWETLRASGRARTAEALTVLEQRAGSWLDPALVSLLSELVLTPGPA
jgi:HD-GYP domain-containing protein (c-di-GMP phosphodiesterase class II)